MRELCDEDIVYLDSVAMIVAGLIQGRELSERIGEPSDENINALIALGEAYMFLYNYVLDNYYNEKEEQDDEAGSSTG